MCGIAGMVRLDRRDATPEDSAAVTRMLQLQIHRGPDGEGLYAHGPAILGQRRLAIIDLRDIALQPMSNETGTIWLTFNGEIYNFRELTAELKAANHTFKTNCDTEVILHGYEQWGMEGLLQRLRGMFAFLLYDADACRGGERPYFFAARDRLGIKPLYYSSNGALAFASEVKALLRSGLVAKDINRSAVATFLSLGSVSNPDTWLQGVQCLPPGHFLAVDRGGTTVRKYWELSYDPVDRIADLGEILHDATQRHLMADVPVGVFLSGGVDSGGVAEMATRGRSAPVCTLTITFEEQDFNEGDQARAFAKCFGTQHHEIPVTQREFAEEIPNLLAAIDQPTADGVNTYFVSRAAKRLGLKVVLSGLGGDEVFFGYPHYQALVAGAGALGRYSNSSALMRKAMAFGASLYGRSWGQEKWQRFDYCRRRPLAEGLYLLVRGFFPPSQVRDLLGIDSSSLDAALDQSMSCKHAFHDNGRVDPNHFHYLEMHRYLHDQLLRDSDVFSMAHSIELRVPLLDNEVVDAGCRIPPGEKVAPGLNKPKLVEALNHPSIREAAARPKRGFTFPFAQWMRSQAGELQERALQGKILDPAGVRQCWQQFSAGRLHWSRAWATVVLASLD